MLRVLHAIHDFLPRHPAGSEIYAFELCRELQALGVQVHILCAEQDLARPHGNLAWRVHEGLGVTELINNWTFASFAETYESPLLNRQLAHLLRALSPDVLHIHNLLNLSFDLPAIAREQQIPTVATLHDYTLVCPSGGQRVHQAEAYVCTEIDPDRCRRCFPQHEFHARLRFGQLARRRPGVRSLARVAGIARRRAPGIFGLLMKAFQRTRGSPLSAADIVRRLDRARRVFETVDLFVAPSPSLAAEYRRLGLPAAKLRVSDYGFVPFAPCAARASGDRLRIGFVGTLVWHKGVHVLLEAAGRLPADRVDVQIFGDPETFPDYVASLRERARGLPVRFMGPFARHQTREVYAGLDVLVVPSLWPENSPLVVHEAFMAGVPVVGARLGGIPDLVTDGRNGVLYDAFSPVELAAALRGLVEEPDRLRRLAAAIPAVKRITEDAREWMAIYREVSARRAVAVELSGDGERPQQPAASGIPGTTAVVLNYRTPDDTLLAVRSLQASRMPFRDLIVVDNGSGDGSEERLREALPGVTILQSGENLGFSGGSNTGVRAALEQGARRVLLLNSDAVLPPETLGWLEAALDADSRLGIVGPILVSRSDPESAASLGLAFSPGTGRLRHRGFGARLASLDGFDRRLVDGVSGCAMLIRREVCDAVGPFAEEYFFGFEDLDFCLRARAAGFLTACVGTAVALHEGSRSIGPRSARRIYFATRNHLLLARRVAPLPAPGLAALRAGSILALNLAHALLSSGVPRVAGLRGYLAGAWDHARGRYGEGPRL